MHYGRSEEAVIQLTILLEDSSWLAKPTEVPHFLLPHSADNLLVLEEVKQHKLNTIHT